MEDSYSILVIDDEKDFIQLINEILGRSHYKIDTIDEGYAGLQMIKHNSYDLIILDLNTNGLDILKKIKDYDSTLPTIILSGDGKTNTVQQAIHLGAKDFLYKPIEWNRLKITINNALVIRRLEREISQLRSQIDKKYNIANLVCNSSKMQEVSRNIEKVIQSDITVCINGESGAGKELVAKIIHFNSHRKNRPFLAVNCSAIPDSLLDEELFGIVNKEFYNRKYGKFEQANGGTIYLDEIAELKPMAQVKILKVLQENQIEPVGSDKPLDIDVRIIAGTDKSLDEEVKKGNFREDLYYRIHVYPIFLPPLRQRKEDIPTLVSNFIEKYNYKNNTTVRQLSAVTMQYLINYDWPGNIRELENVLERAIILAEDDTILCKHLPISIISHGDATINGGTFMDIKRALALSNKIVPLEEIEEEVLKQALKLNNYNMSSTATKLGIGRTTLYRKLQKYQIKIER